ncbi:MAG: endonuclease/exonuclease/phosphatase family protein, partial [Planctomyces sp.]|jgi:endonuclease/exonuclease/phosphatase family metal-dependent hydrolase
VATFNCSLNREAAGQLERDLGTDGDVQARKVARVLRRVRPDIVLLNEFDFSEPAVAAEAFLKNYLSSEVSWAQESPLQYAHRWTGPVNTGVPTGRDLDHDGKSNGPGDAFGFGRFPGQYGMLLLSRYPIRVQDVRTFQKLLWKQMPGALLPLDPGTQRGWYTDEDLGVFRLSSKSHWDIPVEVNGSVLHVLASHPTPPAFDGAEDRNGRRNHDEIRLWRDYLTAGADGWIRDDRGVAGGLSADAEFVVLGDLNADPVDGGSVAGAIQQLLNHPRVQSAPAPASAGGEQAAVQQKGINQQHRGSASEDTADFSDRSVGNLRADYVLPSRGLQVQSARVYWPVGGEAAELVECSDHRLVYVDLLLNR